MVYRLDKPIFRRLMRGPINLPNRRNSILEDKRLKLSEAGLLGFHFCGQMKDCRGSVSTRLTATESSELENITNDNKTFEIAIKSDYHV